MGRGFWIYITKVTKSAKISPKPLEGGAASWVLAPLGNTVRAPRIWVSCGLDLLILHSCFQSPPLQAKTRWEEKQKYSHREEQNLKKKNEIMPFEGTQVDLEITNIIIGDVRQKEKDKYII